MQNCVDCGKQLQRQGNKYCSNKCQGNYQYRICVLKWLKGEVDGGRGITTRNISGHVKRYIVKKYSNKRSIYGWSRINPVTGDVPLELDHIDGNSDNNIESNLRSLCPNCHSLTPSFRNLNKGLGRKWRRSKYIKN